VLHKLDVDEGDDKVERHKTVVKNANIRYDAKKQIAANQRELAEQRERRLLDDDAGEGPEEAAGSAGVEEMADEVEDVDVELQQILQELPDYRSQLNAAMDWFNNHPTMHPDVLFDRNQIITVLYAGAEREKADAAAGRRQVAADANRTPDAVLQQSGNCSTDSSEMKRNHGS